MKVFTIQTFYSIENFYCADIDDFLAQFCFCDAYEVTAEREATAEEQARYNEAVLLGVDAWEASAFALGHIGLYEAVVESSGFNIDPVVSKLFGAYGDLYEDDSAKKAIDFLDILMNAGCDDFEIFGAGVTLEELCEFLRKFYKPVNTSHCTFATLDELIQQFTESYSDYTTA